MTEPNKMVRGLEYGVPTAAEVGDHLELLAHAFAANKDHISTSLRSAGLENLRCVRRGREVLGCLTLVPMGQYFGRRSVRMTGVAGVAVRPDVARTGVATALMRETIDELGRQQVGLSTLYASTQRLYRKVDYEVAGVRYQATLPPREIDIVEPALSLRAPTEADHPAIKALYAEQAVARDGHLNRGAYIWDRVLEDRYGQRTYGMLVCDDTSIEGYVFYRKPTLDPPYHGIQVLDMLASTPRGLRRLWSFLRDLSTALVREVTLFTSPSDAAYLVHRNPGFRLRQTENWMVRIPDVRAALVGRGYPVDMEAQLPFELHDAGRPDNSGRFVLTIRDGRGDVEPGGAGALQLDVRALASMYTGFVAPATLAHLGRLTADPATLATATTVFGGPQPWMPDMF